MLNIWYNTDFMENITSNSLYIVTCVFISTGMFLNFFSYNPILFFLYSGMYKSAQ
jgi:hypothetical protein